MSEIRSPIPIANRTVAVLLLCAAALIGAGIPDPLPGTVAGGEQPDWRERQRLQIVDYLKKSTADAKRIRDRAWAGSDDSAHRASLQSKLGIDPTLRQSKAAWRNLSQGPVAIEEVVSTRTDGLRVRALVFSAGDRLPKRQVLIAVPDSDQTAERFSGIAEGSSPPSGSPDYSDRAFWLRFLPWLNALLTTRCARNLGGRTGGISSTDLDSWWVGP